MSRVPIDYLFEVTGSRKTAITVPFHPGQFSVDLTGPQSIRYPLNGLPPVLERSSIRAQTITISGNTALRARAGYDRKGGVIYAEGPKILYEFQRFLDDWHKEAEHNPKAKLVFRALKEDLHVLVEVQEFNVARNATTSRHTSDWSLTLRAYDYAKPVRPKNLLSPISDMFLAAAELVNKVNGRLAEADNFMAQVRGDLEALRAPFTALQNTANALAGITDKARSILAFPRSLVRDLVNTTQTVVDTVREVERLLIQANPATVLQGRELERLKTIMGFGAEESKRDAVTLLGYSGGSLSAAASPDVPYNGPGGVPDLVQQREYVLETLGTGTLRDLAQRVYDDATRWAEIADFNGWVSATRNGLGRVALPTDVLRVPGAVADVPDPVKVLSDIRMTDGDLTWGASDWLLVSGNENLVQGLLNRISTPLGDSRPFPGYGMPDLLGGVVTLASAGLLVAHVREQVLADPRVDEVQNLEVRDAGDALYVEGVLFAGGAGLPVAIPVG